MRLLHNDGGVAEGVLVQRDEIGIPDRNFVDDSGTLDKKDATQMPSNVVAAHVMIAKISGAR